MQIGLLLGIVTVQYLLSASSTIYGGDSGDLVASAISNSFPHPSGYPLYTVIIQSFFRLPLDLPYATKAALASIFFSICSFYLLTRIIKELTHNKVHIMSLYASILTVASTYVVWLYAVVPEVFPLNTFFVLLLVYLALRLESTQNITYVYLIAFCTGLSFTHHHLIVLCLPSVAFLLYSSKNKLLPIFNKKRSIYTLLFFLAGLSPFLYLVYASYMQSELNWGDATSISGFLDVVLRKGYGTFVAGHFITQIASHRFLQIKNIARFTWTDFTLFGFTIVSIGLIYMTKIKKINPVFKKAFFVLLVLYGPFFFFYANFPIQEPFDFATMERFLHVFYILLTIPLYFGFLSIYKLLLHLFTNLKHSSKNNAHVLSTIVFLALFLLPILLFAKNSKYIVPLTRDTTAENTGYDILSVPNNSIVLLSGDTNLFNTQYVYFSNREFYRSKNIMPIHVSKLSLDYYAKYLKKAYPNLSISPSDSLGKILAKNIGEYTFFSVTKYPLTDQQKHLVWIPNGLVFRLQERESVDIGETIKYIEDFWRSSRNKHLHKFEVEKPFLAKNFFQKDILAIYSTAYQNSGYYISENSNRQSAHEYLERAQTLSPNDADTQYVFSLYFAKRNDCISAEKKLDNAIEMSRDSLYRQEYVKILGNCYKDDENKKRIEEKANNYLRQQDHSLSTF